MIGAVVDLLTAVPVVVIHVVAALPFSVLDVLVLLATIIMTVVLLLLSSVIVVVLVLLGYGGERRAADAEEDECGESFFEQDIYLQLVGWTDEPCCCSGDITFPLRAAKGNGRTSRLLRCAYEEAFLTGSLVTLPDGIAHAVESGHSPGHP